MTLKILLSLAFVGACVFGFYRDPVFTIEILGCMFGAVVLDRIWSL